MKKTEKENSIEKPQAGSIAKAFIIMLSAALLTRYDTAMGISVSLIDPIALDMAQHSLCSEFFK